MAVYRCVPRGWSTIRQAWRSERPYFARMPSTARRRRWGLQVFRGNVLKHLLLERQIGNKTLEPNVFPLPILPIRLA